MRKVSGERRVVGWRASISGNGLEAGCFGVFGASKPVRNSFRWGNTSCLESCCVKVIYPTSLLIIPSPFFHSSLYQPDHTRHRTTPPFFQSRPSAILVPLLHIAPSSSCPKWPLLPSPLPPTTPLRNP